MPSNLQVALIGYGYWGPNYARVLSEMPNVDVAVICDERRERLERAESRFPQVEVTLDFHEVLRHKDIDAVVISTPASTHYTFARLALEASFHVLVEKPLALEVSHCEDLASLSERNQRVLMVAHTFLYNPGIQRLREIICSDAFGRVYYLHSTRTNLGPIRNDVNAIWDLAPHDISIFNYLLGETPLWASAIGSRALRNSRDDVGFITLGYSGGVIGNVHVSWADPNKVREVVVVGSQQRAVFDDLNDLERVRIFEKGVSVGERDAHSFGDFKLLVRDGDIISPRIEFSEPLRNQLADFLAAIVQGRRPLADVMVAMHVVEALKAIESSASERGRAVEVAKCRVASQLS